jgi:hypothetical protein
MFSLDEVPDSQGAGPPLSPARHAQHQVGPSADVVAHSPSSPVDLVSSAGGLQPLLPSELHTGDDGIVDAMKRDSPPELGSWPLPAAPPPCSLSSLSLPSGGYNTARMSQFTSSTKPSVVPSGLLSLH